MNKSFDCIEMKRQAQDIIAKRLEGLSEEEKLKYWQERDRAFREKLKTMQMSTASEQA